LPNPFHKQIQSTDTPPAYPPQGQANGREQPSSARTLPAVRRALRQRRTCMVRMGSAMIGPLPAVMSNGMFMPVSGVRMSENRITPSGWNARHGCSETSTCAPAQRVAQNPVPSPMPQPYLPPPSPRATSTLQAAATHCRAPSARMDRGMPLVAVHPCCALLLPACHGNMRSRDGAIDNVRARESTRGAWTHEQTNTERQRARPASAGCTALGTSGSGGGPPELAPARAQTQSWSQAPLLL